MAVAYWAEECLEQAVQLPGKAVGTAIAVAERSLFQIMPRRVRDAKRQFGMARRNVESIMEIVRVNVSHVRWIVEANFTDKYAVPTEEDIRR